MTGNGICVQPAMLWRRSEAPRSDLMMTSGWLITGGLDIIEERSNTRPFRHDSRHYQERAHFYLRLRGPLHRGHAGTRQALTAAGAAHKPRVSR